MKKSFTLKAAAFGLAVVTAFGASAARPQLAAHSLAPKKVAQLNTAKTRTAQTTATNNGAEAYSVLSANRITRPGQNLDLTQQPVSRAFNPYGAWEDAGTLTYTFTNLFDGKGVDKTYSYQKRVNRNNAENFQIKVANWGAFTQAADGVELPGCELVLTVTPVIDSSTKETTYVVTTTNLETLESDGISLGWQIGISQTEAVDCYFYDHYTWAVKYAATQPNINPEFAPSWYASSEYDPSSGKFTIMPIYGGAGENIGYIGAYGDRNASGAITKYWYDYIQLSGEFFNYNFEVDTNAGYFYRNAGDTSGHYKAYYHLNDNAVGVVQILPGKLEATALQAAFDAMVDQMNNPTSDMAVFTDKEGWFDLDVSKYEDGYYSLVFGVGKAADAQGNMSIEGGYYSVLNDGAEFVLDGFAKYNDVIIPAFLNLIKFNNGSVVTPDALGLPSSYVTTCQVEKSEKTAGLYRLRAPYAEYPRDEVFDYDQPMDYLYYNIADPAKAEVEFSFTGLSMDLGDVFLISYGSAHVVLEGEAQETIYATYADNKLTFPSTTYKQSFQFQNSQGQPVMVEKTMSGILAVMAYIGQNSQGQTGIFFSDWTSPAKPADFLIETGAVDAIENVEAEGAADADAPVEYFNLQGQKVLNPAAGQLVIKKQGSKVTKIIAQ